MGVATRNNASTSRPLQRVNSETKFAVSLLLGVSRRDTKSPDASSDRSAGSGETRPNLSESPSPMNGMQLATYVVPLPFSSSTIPTPTSYDSSATSTPEEQRATIQRQAAIQRFRAKKQRRQFHKKVRYHVRKRLAESRPRYKGRFSKPHTSDAADESKSKQGASSSENKWYASCSVRLVTQYCTSSWAHLTIPHDVMSSDYRLRRYHRGFSSCLLMIGKRDV